MIVSGSQPPSVDLRPGGSDALAGAGPGHLHRWGLLMARRKRVVFMVWALVILAGLGLLPQFMSSLSMTGIFVPGSESSRAADLLARELPATGGSQAILVFSSGTLTSTDPDFRTVVTNAARNVSALSGVTGVELPYGVAATALTAPGGHTALAVVALGGGEQEAMQLAPRLAAAAGSAATPSVSVGATGEPQLNQDMLKVEDADAVTADAIGIPVALVVLVVVFGSLVAAGLPFLLALASLVLTFGAFGALSLLVSGGFNAVLESATLMIGLGIGIDYALFVVTRFREELAGAGGPEAVARTIATAGRMVLVSGSTVIAALAPMLLINDPMMREIALGIMVAVAVLVAAALSLLPATLAGLGPRVNRLAPRLLRGGRRAGPSRRASRLTELLLRRPIAVLVAVALPLGALSALTVEMHTGLDYGLSAYKDLPSGRADAAIAAAFGPGAVSPIEVVFTTAGQPLSAGDLQALSQLDTKLGRDPRVASVISLPVLLGGPSATVQALAAARTDRPLAVSLSPIVNTGRGDTVTVMTVVPRASFDSAEATGLVSALRAELPSALGGTGMRALVGGTSAAIVDLGQELNAKTPLVLLMIIALALAVLAVAFRSALVALVGLAGTLLSVGSAYGLLVLVFQNGAGQAIFNFHPTGFIQDWLPLLLFAVLVGLSTDYQVFLISRVKEEWERSGNPRRAIAVGLERSGRVILSAATIMVIVFASFLFTTELELKELGFALASAILIDAALTRRLLMPAALRLLGNRAWAHPARPARHAEPGAAAPRPVGPGGAASRLRS